MRVLKGIGGFLFASALAARLIVNVYGFGDDVSNLWKSVREVRMPANWLVYLALVFCLTMTADAIAPRQVRRLLRWVWSKVHPVTPDVPVTLSSSAVAGPASPMSGPEPDRESQANEANALHFAMRCDKHRHDHGTINLAFKIAGKAESLPVREKMLDVLCDTHPSQDAIEAFCALYSKETPGDIATLRKATRSVARLARAEPPSAGVSYGYYLERLSRLLALHLEDRATIPAEDAQQIAALVRDLHEWGFARQAEPIERSLAVALRV